MAELLGTNMGCLVTWQVTFSRKRRSLCWRLGKNFNAISIHKRHKLKNLRCAVGFWRTNFETHISSDLLWRQSCLRSTRHGTEKKELWKVKKFCYDFTHKGDVQHIFKSTIKILLELYFAVFFDKVDQTKSGKILRLVFTCDGVGVGVVSGNQKS